jgi:hypothetical protein
MLELVMAMLGQVEDVSVDVRGECVFVEVQDFEGFDEDWSEIYADYDEDAVDALLEWLEEQSVSSYGDFYEIYEFEGFFVKVGYASMDV